MIFRRQIGIFVLGLAFTVLGCSAEAPAEKSFLEYEETSISIDNKDYALRIPKGYRLEMLTAAMETPRLLAFLPNGDLLSGSKTGAIYRLAPPYTTPTVLVSLDSYPHSVALRGEDLFIARSRGLFRVPYKLGQAQIDPKDVELYAPLPDGGNHNSRTVRVGPDGRLYVSLGNSGNCNDEYIGESYPAEKRRGGVLVLDESGPEPAWRAFASGLRNPVGFDWQPKTNVMFGTNNGPDHLGFDQPPEYFSRLDEGSYHGMPWFQFDGEKIVRDNCDGANADPPRPLADVPPPVATFPARNAPMAVAFVKEGEMDPRFVGSAIVALRGSWATNRGLLVRGKASRRHPKLVLVHFAAGAAQEVVDLVTGFQLPDGERWARPVGVAIGPDGALYFTSDSDTNGLFRLAPVKK